MAMFCRASRLLNESMITGEPVPVSKAQRCATLVGGTINGTGALAYRATAVGADTVLAQIIRMVEDAQGAKLPIQSLVDRITGVFVPAVMALAALTVFGLAGLLALILRYGLGAGLGRVRPHHCLPLRDGPRHTHVDHGGHGPRGRARRFVPQG